MDKLLKEASKYINSSRAKNNYKFFKAFPGGYGEGDQFNGMTVPDTRKVAKKFYKEATLQDIQTLLENPIHEIRLIALHILVLKFEKAETDKSQKEIVDFYLANTQYINNWDLVDTSSYKILGAYLIDKKDRSILFKLAKSKNMWEQRIAMISCIVFPKQNDLDDLYKLADLLLEHSHDLMHKAVGWILREAGKVDIDRLKRFIRKNYDRFPRTCLRYAIEKFPEKERQTYLKREF